VTESAAFAVGASASLAVARKAEAGVWGGAPRWKEEAMWEPNTQNSQQLFLFMLMVLGMILGVVGWLRFLT
jgi:hypothetical protein